jgi:hypothetical protein
MFDGVFLCLCTILRKGYHKNILSQIIHIFTASSMSLFLFKPYINGERNLVVEREVVEDGKVSNGAH